ncbi:MAG TPA: PA2779 family protein [Longimicrobiales bacterium]
MKKTFAPAAALTAGLLFAVPAAAQQEAWTQGDEDRATILRFMEREEVSGVAEGYGVDPQDMGRGVLRLNDADAARVADQVRDAEQAMAADTITMTTTTLIIILLVIILLVLIL